jgi:hypothetical protein
MATIASSTYLRSWTFIASFIIVRFVVDQYPFLLEALARVDDNTFFFQQHFKVVCDLLPSRACACLFSFEQLIWQQMIRFQNSISERLHHHTLFNMLFDGIFEAHHARILSCSGQRRMFGYSSTNLPKLLTKFLDFFHNASHTT